MKIRPMCINTNSTDDLKKKLVEFARSFGHTARPEQLGYVVFQDMDKNGEWIAYAAITQPVVLFPAYHPDHCSPRQTVEVTKQLVHWGNIQFGEVHIGVRKDSKIFETKERLADLATDGIGFHNYEILVSQ